MPDWEKEEEQSKFLPSAIHPPILLADAKTRQIRERNTPVPGMTKQQARVERLHVWSVCLFPCLGLLICMLHSKTVIVKYNTFLNSLRHSSNYLVGEGLWKPPNLEPVSQKCEFGKPGTLKVLLMSAVCADLLGVLHFKPVGSGKLQVASAKRWCNILLWYFWFCFLVLGVGVLQYIFMSEMALF